MASGASASRATRNPDDGDQGARPSSAPGAVEGEDSDDEDAFHAAQLRAPTGAFIPGSAVTALSRGLGAVTLGESERPAAAAPAAAASAPSTSTPGKEEKPTAGAAASSRTPLPIDLDSNNTLFGTDRVTVRPYNRFTRGLVTELSTGVVEGSYKAEQNPRTQGWGFSCTMSWGGKYWHVTGNGKGSELLQNVGK